MSWTKRAEERVFARYGLKTAARRGIREMRSAFQAVERGLPGAAQQLSSLEAHAPQILAGRQRAGIRTLGAGVEGVAQHMMTPQGSQVLKIHDPTSAMYNPAVIAGKQKLIGQNVPGLMQLHGMETMPHQVGGRAAPAFTGEYVPGKTVGETMRTPGMHAQTSDQYHAYMQQMHNTHAQGMGFFDTHAGNVKVTPSGDLKAFDYMPVPQHELLPPEQRGHANIMQQNLKAPFESDFVRGFNINQDHAPQLRDQLLGQHADQLHAGLQGTPQQAQWARQQEARADRHYAGQLQGMAFSGRAPQPFQPSRPMPAGAVASGPVAPAPVRTATEPVAAGTVPMRRPAPPGTPLQQAGTVPLRPNALGVAGTVPLRRPGL
jgi:hypothetical protein